MRGWHLVPESWRSAGLSLLIDFNEVIKRISPGRHAVMGRSHFTAAFGPWTAFLHIQTAMRIDRHPTHEPQWKGCRSRRLRN